MPSVVLLCFKRRHLGVEVEGLGWMERGGEYKHFLSCFVPGPNCPQYCYPDLPPVDAGRDVGQSCRTLESSKYAIDSHKDQRRKKTLGISEALPRLPSLPAEQRDFKGKDLAVLLAAESAQRSTRFRAKLRVQC